MVPEQIQRRCVNQVVALESECLAPGVPDAYDRLLQIDRARLCLSELQDRVLAGFVTSCDTRLDRRMQGIYRSVTVDESVRIGREPGVEPGRTLHDSSRLKREQSALDVLGRDV